MSWCPRACWPATPWAPWPSSASACVTAAASAGIDVRKHKLLAFVISALYAGCAGSLIAHLAPGFLHPNSFTIVEMVTVLLMIVMGGIGHIWGGVIGAVIVTIVFDLTREWQQYQLIAFGMVVVDSFGTFFKLFSVYFDMEIVCMRVFH